MHRDDGFVYYNGRSMYRNRRAPRLGMGTDLIKKPGGQSARQLDSHTIEQTYHRNMHRSLSALAPIASHSSLWIHMSLRLSRLQITEAPFQHTNLGFKPRGGGTMATWSEGIPFARRSGGSLVISLNWSGPTSAYLSEMNWFRPFRADVPPISRMVVEAVLILFSVPALAIAAAIAPSNGDLEAS